MDAETLDAEVKARIPEDQKKRLREIARERHLKLADIVREALREKIAASPASAEACAS
jgi:predicted transcriptional regulator